MVSGKNKEVLNQAGNFELPSGLADNQVARKVSQIQFSGENYYLALTSEAEGYRSTVYNDGAYMPLATATTSQCRASTTTRTY